MASTGSSGSHHCVHCLFKIPRAKCAKRSRLRPSGTFFDKPTNSRSKTSLTGGFPYFPPLRFFSIRFITIHFLNEKFAPPRGIRAKVMYILTFPYPMEGFTGSGLCLKIPVLLGICKQRGPRILRMDSQGDCKASEKENLSGKSVKVP